jgi:hypothetical protein
VVPAFLFFFGFFFFFFFLDSKIDSIPKVMMLYIDSAPNALLTTNRELSISVILLICCFGIAGASFQLAFIRKLEDSYGRFLGHSLYNKLI